MSHRLRRLKVTPDGDGQPSYALTINGSAAAHGFECPHLVGFISSEFVRCIYFRKLLENATLTPQLVISVINQAGQQISSGFELGARIDGDRSPLRPSRQNFPCRFSCGSQSDFERSRCLMALMKSHNLSAASMYKVLEAVSTFKSDFEKSHVIIAVSGMGSFDEHQIDSYLKIVDSIGSDFERGRSLMTLMQQHKLGNVAVAKILEAAGRMKTDFEKSRVLQKVAKRYQLEGNLQEIYIKSAESIGSEFERNRVLAAVVRRASL